MVFRAQVCVLVVTMVRSCEQPSRTCVRVCVCCTNLPHSDNSVCYEDEEDDEGLHEGCDCFLAFLEHGQHLTRRKVFPLSEHDAVTRLLLPCSDV